MNEAATIKFIELESKDEAVAIVRYTEASVAVCLSIKRNGDLEVLMSKDDARKLIDALSKAVG